MGEAWRQRLLCSCSITFFLERTSGTDFIKQKQSFFVIKDWPVILKLPAQSHEQTIQQESTGEGGGPPPPNPYRLSLLQEEKNTLVA